MRWLARQLRHHKLRTALVILLGLMALGVIFREPILMRMGDYLVLSEPPQRVDVIRVLGGSPDRYLYGIELYKQGYGEKIIFSLWNDYMPLLQRTKNQIIQEYALAEGVPQEAVTYWETESTYHEAELTRDYVMRENVSSMMIVSSPYHMRRASLVFDRLIGDEVEIYYVPVPESWSDFRRDWWRDEESTVAVLHEYVSMIYYFFKYVL